MPSSPHVPITTRVTEDMIRRVLRHPRVKDVVEADLVMLDASPVYEKNKRPYFPYALILVDAGSGVALAIDLLTPRPPSKMWGDVAPIATRLDGIGFIPGTIRVRTEIMEFLMRDTCRIPAAEGETDQDPVEAGRRDLMSCTPT